MCSTASFRVYSNAASDAPLVGRRILEERQRLVSVGRDDDRSNAPLAVVGAQLDAVGVAPHRAHPESELEARPELLGDRVARRFGCRR